MSTNTPNEFNTTEQRPWFHPQNNNSKDVSIPAHNLTFPVGLTALDESFTRGIRIRSYPSNITSQSVRFHLDACIDTFLYSAAMTWLEISDNDRDFQWGRCSTQDDQPWNQFQKETTHQITFKRPFGSPPKIVLWLNELDLQSDHNYRVKSYATNISTTGFTLHLDTWADTVLTTAGATWIAHPANRSNIASGTYNTLDIRPVEQPQIVNKGAVSFAKVFEKVPRVYAALNVIDIGCSTNLRIRSLIDDVTTTSMTWQLNTWGDTVLYSAGASWLAIQDF